MTKEEQQELIDYVAFLNLQYNKSLDAITPDGNLLIEKISNKYPNWAMADYRLELSSKIFNLIWEEEVEEDK